MESPGAAQRITPSLDPRDADTADRVDEAPRSGRFVGRRQEMALLDRALERVEIGSARAVEVVGEPGIGKTRLLAEFCAQAARRGRLVLAGRAAEFECEAPFELVVQALDDHLAALDLAELGAIAGCELDELAAVFPSLPRRSLAPPDRHRLHRAVRALLEGIAAPRGLVLVLDDVHGADEASIGLLAHLLRHPPRAPVLLALSYRPWQAPEQLTAPLARAVMDGLADRLELGPLSVEETGALLGEGVSLARRDALYRNSGGNPFYLKALARTGDGPDCALAGTSDDDKADAVPPAVQAVVLAEFEALSKLGQLVAHAAAVVGDPFDAWLVADVAGLSEAETLAGIDELLAADLARPVGSTPRFRYRHFVVRRVAYDAVSAGWRVTAHARAAAALAARKASTVARAHHVARAARPGDEAAITVLVEAARAILPRAPAAAAQWVQDAVRLLPDEGEAVPRRLELLIELAHAWGLAGRLHEARDILHDVLSLLPPEPSERRAWTIVQCAGVERVLGRYAEARALLHRELLGLPEHTSPAAAALMVELSTVSLAHGGFDDDRIWVQRGLQVARRHDDPILRATALSAAALAACFAGEINEADERAREAASIVDELPDGELAERQTMLGFLGWSEVYLERYDEAHRHLERGLSLASATGRGGADPTLLAALTTLHLRLGRLDEASGRAEDTVEAALRLGSDELLRTALTVQCSAAIAAGDLELALRVGGQVVRLVGPARTRWSVLARVTAGSARLAVGDVDAGITAILEAGDGPELPTIAQVLRPRLYEALASAEMARGRHQAAQTWADRAEAVVRGLPLRWPAGYALLTRAQTLMASEPNLAAEHAQAAVAAFTEIGARFLAGRAHLCAATALEAAGNGALAVAELTLAEALFEACGAPHLHEQAVHAQQRLGWRMRRDDQGRSAGGLSALTPRELQIAELVSQGYTNQQIARKLSVSPKTVETHLSRAFAKLGVPSRAALASALAQGKA